MPGRSLHTVVDNDDDGPCTIQCSKEEGTARASERTPLQNIWIHYKERNKSTGNVVFLFFLLLLLLLLLLLRFIRFHFYILIDDSVTNGERRKGFKKKVERRSATKFERETIPPWSLLQRPLMIVLTPLSDSSRVEKISSVRRHYPSDRPSVYYYRSLFLLLLYNHHHHHHGRVAAVIIVKCLAYSWRCCKRVGARILTWKIWDARTLEGRRCALHWTGLLGSLNDVTLTHAREKTTAHKMKPRTDNVIRLPFSLSPLLVSHLLLNCCCCCLWN